MAAPRAPAPVTASTENRTSRSVLEEYGEKIQQQATRIANNYREYLHGNLKRATYPNDKRPKGTTPENPCELNHEYHTNVSVGYGKDNPCGSISTVRFSDKYGGQCTNEKIHGNEEKDGKDIGACAPFRRLFLCDQNLAYMPEHKINNTHDLLLEVLLAAKYEGQSLVEKYNEYKETNTDSDFNICTALARSFADIGDIVRGKDLFRGYNETDKLQKVILQQRLKDIFAKIHSEVTNGKKGHKSAEAKKHYGSDENFFQLREDWWALNRKEVWRAITCGAGAADEYFKKSGKLEFEFSNGQCGRDGENVPTNLDYVPQYLRWFEEWADDFCRKRKVKLENAIKFCRGTDSSGKDRYCSLNGYDCTKGFQKKDSCSSDSNCTACSNICIPYDAWLRNQRNEFEKQKEKYKNEINGNDLLQNNKNNSINNKYHYEFYKNFREKGYKNLDEFLKVLNNGRYCKEGVKGESPINFNGTGNTDAFDRSKYCQPCPNCVVKCVGGTCEQDENDENCRSKLIKKILQSEETTEIHVLNSDDKQGDITKKLEDFCREQAEYKGENVQKWKCYNKNNDYNNCEMNISSYKDANERNLMLSVECFYSWTRNLLIDTIRWEHQLKNCINNTNVTDCESKCIKSCECYEKWIKQKEHEWKQVKKVFENQDKNTHNYYDKLKDVFNSFLFPVRGKLDQDEKVKWDQFREDLEKKFESPKKNTDAADSKDAIELLLDHLNDNAITCKDNNSNESCENSKGSKKNPCIKNPNNSNKPPKTVKHIAEMMQRRAREQLEAGAGEINLKGDASKGTYTSSGKAVALNDICSIDVQHSNRNNENSKGPCYNKDGGRTMFDINEGWKPGSAIGMTDQYAYMPPRRQHFCTSNLEYLQTSMSPLNGSDYKLVNNSFLGDVLLSANKQVEWIKKNYKDQRHLNDNETMCRAVKYSFADLGDIIKGTDLWDKNHGENKIQETLKQIFRTLYNLLSKHVPQKYGDDKDNKIPYKKLREDWWEANRHQVWRAMKCAIKKNNIETCKGIPIEDYIPQRLRWMTELAEWYVKFQSKVNKQCERRVIKSNHEGKAISSTHFISKCEEYKKKMKSWKDQWTKLGKKYSLLYAKAKVNAFKDGRDGSKIDVQDKDQPVYDFLFNLHVQNGGKVGERTTTLSRSIENSSTSIDTPYDNAGAYVHDTGDLSGYNNKKEFCEGGRTFKITDTEDATPLPPSSDDDNQVPAPEGDEDGKTEEEEEEEEDEEEEGEGEDEEEVLPEAPQEPTLPPTDDVKVCDIVEVILKGNNGTTKVGECNPKDQGARYPGWDCTNPILVTKNGECMPPRRIKLCLFYLADINEQNKIHNQDDLRKAFIKTAAAETFLSWNYYKKKNGNAQQQLEVGKIPPEFLRSMFYTFGDYRDILFNTDISAKTENGDITKAKNTIDRILPKEDGKTPDEGRKAWWNGIKENVWEGMLCALSYDTTNKNMDYNAHTKLNPTYGYNAIKSELEDFVNRPQFLRWFTEWGDQFCREREEQLQILQDACKEYECGDIDEGKKQKCEEACKAYQKWIQTWKTQYEQQREKFKKDKDGKKYKDYPSTVSDINNARDVHEYINRQLEKLCGNGNCKCMEKVSIQSQTQPQKKTQEQPDSFDGYDMPASLDVKPDIVKDKCPCLPQKIEKPDSTLNCIDTSAFELKKEAQKSIKDVKKTLSGKNSQNVYEKINNDENKNDGTICKIKENNSEKNNICKDNGNHFDKNEEWECKNETVSLIKEDICIPPRRKHMCTKPLKELEIDKDKNIEELFKKVLLTAAYEGKHIMDSWDKAKEPKKKTQICDAMKYSFADLGDIIIGRDIYEGDNKKIEHNLKKVFTNIYNNNKEKLSQYNDNGDSKYTKLREAWWDTNRKDIWNAMTCTAPKYANILKRIENDSTSFMVEYYCGHNSDPPVDDYIPQPFRWMKEWSENYCNAQNNILSIFEDCEYCKINKEKCKQTKYGSCKECKKKCDDYKKFVEIWEKQYEILKKSYENVYNKVIKNSSKASDETDRNDTHIKNFVNELKKNCKIDQPKFIDSVDKYLDKGNYCKTVRFQKDVSNNKTYAFDNPPKRYKESCRCAKIFEEVDQCPVDEKECNKYGNHHCIEKYFNKRLYDRTNRSVTDGSNTNKDVIVPPRRKELCLSSISIYSSEIDTETKFKEYILHDASNEAKMLSQYYNSDNEKALQAIKYSFADIGNIVKGDDMLDDLEVVQKKLNEIFKQNKNGNVSDNRKKWWENNKEKIWNVMMCNYDGTDKTSSSCPSHGDIDEQDQFLRWFQEWGENFCTGRNELYENLVSECKSAKCNTSNGSVGKPECTEACEKYKNYILSKEKEYEIQKKKYDNRSRNSYDNKKAHNFLIYNCNENKCHCISNHIDNEQNWKDAYQTLDQTELKHKCMCKPPPPPVQPPPADQPFDPTILQTTIPFGVALALGSIAFFFMKVIYVYVVYMYIYMFLYMYVSVFLHMYVFYIYFIYIYLFILKKEKRKK